MRTSADNIPMSYSDRPRRSLFLYTLGAFWTVVAGVGLVAGAALDESAYGLIFGAFGGALGLLALALLALEWRLARHRPGPVIGRDQRGSAATVVGRTRWMTVLSGTSVLIFASASLAAAVAAFAQDDRLAAVVLLLFGAWMASLLVPLLRGQVETGGLYLTPEGLTHRKDARWWHVGWDDVAGVVIEEPFVVVLRDGVQVQRGRTTRWGWQRDVRSRQGALGVQTRYLALDAGVIGFLILAYRDRPDLRDQLGTPASLDWQILRSDT
jgi:hypothetical protein